MTALDMVLLLVGGVLAGLAGSMAGLASLFSYPALLAVGLPAVTANVTNTVALTFSTVGSVLGSRPELRGQAASIRRFGLLAAVGGALGAGLLLLTPSDTFEVVVPFLVASASVILLLQPRLRRLAARGSSPVPDGGPVPVGGAGRRTRPLVLLGILATSVYGGYFGAAAGVVMLALLGVVLPESLLRVNALKSVLLGFANGVAALGFILFGDVDWLAALPLALGVLAGSATGPSLARRIPTAALRIGVATAGLILATALYLDAT